MIIRKGEWTKGIWAQKMLKRSSAIEVDDLIV